MPVEAPVALRPLTAEDALHWLALRLVFGLGTRNSIKILEKFRTPQAIFRASLSELEGAGVPPSVARSILSGTTSMKQPPNTHPAALTKTGNLALTLSAQGDYPR